MSKCMFLIFFLFLASFLLGRPARAQYFYYGYYFPTYPSNCLKGGCSSSYTAAAWASLGLLAIDSALAVHEYSKALQAQTDYHLYQIEQMKAAANFPQTLRDYQNVLRVQSFFEEDMSGNTQSKTPKVAPLTPSSSEIRR